MPVDSERKTYGKRLSTTQMGWLAQKSMQAYSLWMAWLYQSDPNKQKALKDMQTPEDRELVRKAYQRTEQQERR